MIELKQGATKNTNYRIFDTSNGQHPIVISLIKIMKYTQMSVGE